MFERFRRERDSGGVATLERPPRSTHSIPTTASGVAILDAPPNLTIGVQTTTPEPTTIRRNRPTIDQMRAPDDPAWWSHVLDHCQSQPASHVERSLSIIWSVVPPEMYMLVAGVPPCAMFTDGPG